jgi:riboflavin synthase
MFSGIVSEVGEVGGEVGPQGGRLRVAARGLPADLRIGESVAVSGICLTVVEIPGGGFSADVMPETARRTTLGTLRRGDGVNLEPSLAFGERVGGHLVSGHVDAVGTVIETHPEGGARWVTIALPETLARYVVEKGCIAVDGISLTVVDAARDRFTVSLIPHTLAATTAQHWRAGSGVNLEVDLAAKYVQRGLGWEPAP